MVIYYYGDLKTVVMLNRVVKLSLHLLVNQNESVQIKKIQLVMVSLRKRSAFFG